MAISFRRFVVLEATAVAAMNAGINALYTWWLWRSRGALPLNGIGGIALDLASTPVWIALLSTLLGLATIRRKLSSGSVRRPRLQVPHVLRALPDAIVLRSIVLGAAAALTLGVPLLLALSASDAVSLSLAHAVLAKVALTIILSLAIVPIVIFTVPAEPNGS
jgi:hypothetical protein